MKLIHKNAEIATGVVIRGVDQAIHGDIFSIGDGRYLVRWKNGKRIRLSECECLSSDPIRDGRWQMKDADEQ